MRVNIKLNKEQFKKLSQIMDDHTMIKKRFVEEHLMKDGIDNYVLFLDDALLNSVVFECKSESGSVCGECGSEPCECNGQFGVGA